MSKNCKDCQQEYVCPICGKVYVVKCYFDRHMKKHQEDVKDLSDKHQELINEIEKPKDGIEGVLETINKKIEELDDIEETIKEEKVEISLKDEIKGFINGLGGRRTACKYDIDKMFNWYKKIYPQSNINLDWTCGPCVQHVYKRLNDYIK